MFAIIKTSGRQFRVEPGAVIAIDGHNAGETGGEVSFDQVLLVSNDAGDVTAGTPFVSGAKVLGVIGEHGKRQEGPHLQEEAAQAVPSDQGPP